MANASYLENNDYSVLNFKPYELPYESVLKEVATKNAYWQRGATQVINAYSNVLGIDPYLSKNKEQLTKFKESADVKIKQLLSSDLSLIENAAQVNEVYKPLFDSSNEVASEILKDNQLYSNYKTNLSDIEKAKTTKNGEQYSPFNEKALHMQFEDYLNAKNDPNASASDFYDKLGSVKYQPYYDYSDNLLKYLKECEGSSTEKVSDSINPGYLTTTTTSGRSVLQTRGCIESFLQADGKASSQIALEGFVSYGKDYNKIRSEYSAYAQDEYTNIEKQKELIAENLLQLPILYPNGGEEYNMYRKYFTEQQKALSDQAFNMGNTLAKLNDEKEGNMFVKKNYESLSANLYTQSLSKRLGQSYATQSESTDMEADPYALLQKKYDYETQGKVRDAQIKAAEEKSKATGNYPVKESAEADEVEFSLDKYDNQILANKEALNESKNVLVNSYLEDGINSLESTGAPLTAEEKKGLLDFKNKALSKTEDQFLATMGPLATKLIKAGKNQQNSPFLKEYYGYINTSNYNKSLLYQKEVYNDVIKKTFEKDIIANKEKIRKEYESKGVTYDDTTLELMAKEKTGLGVRTRYTDKDGNKKSIYIDFDKSLESQGIVDISYRPQANMELAHIYSYHGQIINLPEYDNKKAKYLEIKNKKIKTKFASNTLGVTPVEVNVGVGTKDEHELFSYLKSKIGNIDITPEGGTTKTIIGKGFTVDGVYADGSISIKIPQKSSKSLDNSIQNSFSEENLVIVKEERSDIDDNATYYKIKNFSSAYTDQFKNLLSGTVISQTRDFIRNNWANNSVNFKKYGVNKDKIKLGTHVGSDGGIYTILVRDSEMKKLAQDANYEGSMSYEVVYPNNTKVYYIGQKNLFTDLNKF